MRTSGPDPHRGAPSTDRLTQRLGDFSTAAAGGRLSGALFVLSGAIVLSASILAPSSTNRAGVALIGVAAVLSGIVIWNLPWRRWKRSSTLWMFVPALSLIGLHNVLTRADGFRFDVFFLVVFAWVGLAHPPGTSVKLSPTLAVGYLLPALFTPVNMTVLVGGLAYTLPVCVLIGETAAWASERVRRSEQAMRSSEERFRSLVQNAADGITLVDPTGLISYESPAIESMLGYAASERLGTPASDYLDPADAESLRTVIRAMPPGGTTRVEIRVRHRDGRWRWCDATLRDLRSVPAVGGIVINLSDVTERRAATEALAERESSFRSLFSANPHPMWVFDVETLAIHEVNEAAIHHYGYSRSEFLALRVTDLQVMNDNAPAPDATRDIGGPVSGTSRHRVADGRIIDVEVTAHLLEFRGRPSALVAVRDVTDRNALDAQLRHQAFHDSLTNLANRALFADRVDHALRRRHDNSVSLLLIDLDGFKNVNDSLGHVIGDDLLVQVAERLCAAVRPADTVARLGGDEFAVLLEDLPSTISPALAAERLLAALASPFVVAAHELSISASIGIAVADGTDSSPDVLLRDADVAMYRAKAEGKGTFVMFQPAMHGAALDRLRMDADLRRGIEDEQFELHYQPMLDLQTGAVVGCEALVRWNHPRRGLLGPDQFVPAAEESGAIVALGRWILAEACRRLAEHPQMGISVNLSARQLTDPGFALDLAAVLRDTAIDPGRLTLEITESVLMRNTAASLGLLSRIRATGVRLSIDDFGTGYSSLSYLRTFQVDELKIDKSFVDGLPGDRQGVTLVEGIVRLANTLGLATVAEGIETAGQQAILFTLGCDVAQGFHFAKPMPIAELEQYLALRSPGRAGMNRATAG